MLGKCKAPTVTREQGALKKTAFLEKQRFWRSLMIGLPVQLFIPDYTLHSSPASPNPTGTLGERKVLPVIANPVPSILRPKPLHGPAQLCHVSLDSRILCRVTRYTTAMHWSLTQFTPASMGVQPQNTIERSFAIGAMA